MIKTAGEAKQMPCIARLKVWEGMCGAYECLAWQYFWDERDSADGVKHTHGNKGHGGKDANKRGYCGLTK